MKTLNKTLLALLAGTVMTAGAQAATYSNSSYSSNSAYGYTGHPYVGVKAGQFDADVEGASSSDNATAYGIYAGYNFDPNWGVEAEYVGSDDADVTLNTSAPNVKADGTYDAKTYGIYGTYRYMFPNSAIYGKAKLGVARTEIDADANNFRLVGVNGSVPSNMTKVTSSSKDTSLAGGLGLGYQATPNFGVEAEYDYASSDANLWTIGAHYKF